MFFLWYVDVWLPAVADYTCYNPDIRWYQKMYEPITVKGDQYAAVSIQSESFGWLLYENCYEKWLHIVPQKAKDRKWKAPKYNKDDEDTHKYHLCKWSDCRTGQVKGGGWKPGAYTQFNKNL